MSHQSLRRFLSELIQQEASKITEPKRSGLSVDQLGLKPSGGIHNILTVYNQATPTEKDYWSKWYHNAKTDVEDLAKQHDLPFPVLAAVVATLSPGNKWNMNLLAAEKLLQGESGINAYPRQVKKAQEILQSGNTGLVSGPKVTVFFNSLVNPELVEKDMVLDGHAINIWRGEKTHLKGLASPNSKERAQMLHDYQMAANELGVPVQAVQAVTWYIWKYTGKTAPLEAPVGQYDVTKFLAKQRPENDDGEPEFVARTGTVRKSNSPGQVGVAMEANAVGAGSVVGAGMGDGTEDSKKLMWSGDEPMKEGLSSERVMFHVTPWSNWKSIKRQGLVPQTGERGIYGDSDEPRIYLFADLPTLEDAMTNWFLDKFEETRWFAILQVRVPDNLELFDDPEIAGSFYVREVIPPQNITLIRKNDAGLDETVIPSQEVDDRYMTLADLYGQYNTPDQDELIWEYVGYVEYEETPFRIVQVDPTELANTARNKNFLDPKSMHRDDRVRVRAFEKISDELSRRTIIVVDGTDIADGFHRVAAMSNKGVKTVRALDLSQPKPGDE